MAIITGSDIGSGNSSANGFPNLLQSTPLGVPTSTTWSSSFGTSANRWEFVGSGFGGVQGGLPSVGTITSFNYFDGGSVRMSVTGLSLDMATFYQLRVAGNSEALMSFIFASDDTYTGGTGSDTFFGYGGNDVFTGGAGSDRFVGGDGNDTGNGGDGSDWLEGGAGVNILNGNAGDDIINSIGGGDTLDGGDGIDLLELSCNSNVGIAFTNINLASAAGVTFANGTIARNFERFSFSGGSGNDTLIIQGPVVGTNSFTGGLGLDTLKWDMSGYSANIIMGYNGPTQDGYISISSFPALGFSGVEKFELLGGTGNDTLGGGFGDDILDGGIGNDRLQDSAGQFGVSSGGNDVLRGGAGDDIIIGFGGNNTLSGGDGNDQISSGRHLTPGPAPGPGPQNDQTAAVDLIDGGAGVDILDLTRFNVTANMVVDFRQMTTATGITLVDGTIIRNVEKLGSFSGGSGNDVVTIGLSNLPGPNAAAGYYRVDLYTGNDKIVLDLTGATFDINFSGVSLAMGTNLLALFAEELEIMAGSGNDMIEPTFYSRLLIDGGSGNDFIKGWQRDDILIGGNGDDVLIGDWGGDVLNGGLGIDTASYSSATSGVLVFGTDNRNWIGDAQGDQFVSIENIIGSDFDDMLGMDSGNNIIDGRAGNDVLYGQGGGDTLIGGAGFDTVSYATAGVGIYVFIGDGGNWTGDAAGDVYSSIEAIIGTASNDILGMDGGNNRIDGAAGDDVLYGQGGGDMLIGGSGFDTASYATATSGVYVFFGDGGAWTGDAAGDTYSSIEAIVGTNFNDIIGMDDFANTLAGGGGDDVLYGEGGGDRLFGNAGFDTVSYAFAPSGIYVLFADLGNATGDAAGDSEFSSIESIVGSAFDDIIGMGDFNDTLAGGGGNDVLLGNGGGDKFFGNDGFDTVSYALAGSGIYVFFADLGNATGDARGDSEFSSIESIVGSSFNDIIGMGNFADTIIAGAGNDILFGMGGNDTLWGGSGADLFAYNGAGFGADTIRDFQDGVDRIDFSRMAGVNYASLSITNVSGGVQVALGTDTILISGANTGLISAADFLFA